MKRISGFTLVELSIVLIIVGLLISLSLPALKKYGLYQNYHKTKIKMIEVNKSINMYFSIKGELPCPASMNQNENGRYSYRPIDCDNLDALIKDAKRFGIDIFKDNDDVVLSGFLPIYDLGVPQNSAVDSWGRQIKYHVSYDLTKQKTYRQFGGNIALENTKGESINWSLGKAQYAIISQGERGCERHLKDFKNCEPNNALLASELSFGEDEYFDDLVVYENYINIRNEFSGLECSISDYFDKNIIIPYKDIKKNNNDLVAADGSLVICNKRVLKTLRKNPDHCMTLECKNGKLINKQVVIE